MFSGKSSVIFKCYVKQSKVITLKETKGEVILANGKLNARFDGQTIVFPAVLQLALLPLLQWEFITLHHLCAFARGDNVLVSLAFPPDAALRGKPMEVDWALSLLHYYAPPASVFDLVVNCIHAVKFLSTRLPFFPQSERSLIEAFAALPNTVKKAIVCLFLHKMALSSLISERSTEALSVPQLLFERINHREVLHSFHEALTACKSSASDQEGNAIAFCSGWLSAVQSRGGPTVAASQPGVALGASGYRADLSVAAVRCFLKVMLLLFPDQVHDEEGADLQHILRGLTGVSRFYHCNVRNRVLFMEDEFMFRQ